MTAVFKCVCEPLYPLPSDYRMHGRKVSSDDELTDPTKAMLGKVGQTFFQEPVEVMGGRYGKWLRLHADYVRKLTWERALLLTTEMEQGWINARMSYNK